MQVDLNSRLLAAKTDASLLNSLITDYLPFIKKTITAVFPHLQEQEEALSEAMLSFTRSVRTYTPEKGAFFPYSRKVIRNRLLDIAYKELRYLEKLLHLHDRPADTRLGEAAEYTQKLAKEQKELQVEIQLLKDELKAWGFTLRDLASQCPKEERSRKTCRIITGHIIRDTKLLERMKRTHRLPISQLKAATGFSQKMLDKYRRFIVALVIVETGDYPCIRSLSLFEGDG
ncbi:MAG: hypothetical protein LBM77_05930 [Spirochaetaceae bacterium]|jgi:RNA polymerase sigma factor|nr:hypothetical protein [Spirochaetaceae bacterium]